MLNYAQPISLISPLDSLWVQPKQTENECFQNNLSIVVTQSSQQFGDSLVTG